MTYCCSPTRKVASQGLPRLKRLDFPMRFEILQKLGSGKLCVLFNRTNSNTTSVIFKVKIQLSELDS